MKAIVKFGSKDIVVIPGAKVSVDRVSDVKAGDNIDTDQVLYVSEDSEKDPVIGQPYVKGAKVYFKVSRHFRDKKVIVFKKRSKKHYKKKRGHRQDLTELLVEKIEVGG
ncbi:50S ribosomal protein L21 [Elusimicrobiota bacterium]